MFLVGICEANSEMIRFATHKRHLSAYPHTPLGNLRQVAVPFVRSEQFSRSLLRDVKISPVFNGIYVKGKPLNNPLRKIFYYKYKEGITNEKNCNYRIRSCRLRRI